MTVNLTYLGENQCQDSGRDINRKLNAHGNINKHMIGVVVLTDAVHSESNRVHRKGEYMI